MSCPEEVVASADDELLSFLLVDDTPCAEFSGDEANLLGDWGLLEPEVRLLSGAEHREVS